MELGVKTAAKKAFFPAEGAEAPLCLQQVLTQQSPCALQQGRTSSGRVQGYPSCDSCLFAVAAGHRICLICRMDSAYSLAKSADISQVCSAGKSLSASGSSSLL